MGPRKANLFPILMVVLGFALGCGAGSIFWLSRNARLLELEQFNQVNHQVRLLRQVRDGKGEEVRREQEAELAGALACIAVMKKGKPLTPSQQATVIRARNYLAESPLGAFHGDMDADIQKLLGTAR